MGYDEPRFIGLSYYGEPPTFPGLAQVFTASAAVVTSTEAAQANILVPDACTFANGVVWVDTIGQGSAYTVQLQSGTTALATAVVLNTAGSSALFTTLAGNVNVIAAGGTIAVAVIGTGTASATQTSPVFRMALSLKRQFV